jgi:flagella basal body P-ring formation protein FlgA
MTRFYPTLIKSLVMITLFGMVTTAKADPLPLQLKTEAVVTQDVIRVGDLWENAGDKADMAIAQAPKPGRRVSLDTRWLTTLASNNGINWRPSSQFEHIVVERSGRAIELPLIESELREALTLEGLPTTSNFEITNRQNLSVIIPADAPATIAIKEMVMDSRTQRFAAVIEAPAGSPQAIRVKITGRTFATTRVPVLSHAMNRGETIASKDLIWTEVRDDNLHQDLVIDPKQLIGMEPRQLLKANNPVRLADLQRPMAVSRNGLVTLLLQTPYMTLTAQGRAMDDAGIGDTVRVTNLQTKQVIEARVQAPGTVVVAATSQIIQTAASRSLTTAAN